MRKKTIIVTQATQVTVIWLNRPEVRNAIDSKMMRELDAVLAAVDSNPSVRAVVLAGKGPVFCSGVDLRWIKRAPGLSGSSPDAIGMAGLLLRLNRMKKPLVARIHGAAYGGAVGLIAACDIAVASMETDFCLSETRLGLSGASTTPYLVRAIGERQARRYVLSGEVFTAAEAYRIGLIHELVPLEELDARINGFLGHLMLGGPKAAQAAKALIAPPLESPDSKHFQSVTGSLFKKLPASSETNEGIDAFFKKRQPSWVGTGIRAVPRKKSQKTGRR